MKIKLIAIAAIALSPAVVLGQTRSHIRVSKDGSHATSTGDVTTSPSSTTTTPSSSTTTDSSSMTTSPSTTPTTDSTQLGTGAPAPTPTHSQQTDSSTTTTTPPNASTTTTGTDTTTNGAMPRSNLNVSPIDSTRMGMPSTRESLRADSARAARRDSTTATDTTKPPR